MGYLRDAMRLILDTTASAAELSKLAGTTAVTADFTRLHDIGASAAEIDAVADLSSAKGIHRILRATVTLDGLSAEQASGITLPAVCVVHKCWYEVTTLKALGAVDIGTPAVGGGDPNGFVAAGAYTAAGFVDGPVGALLPDDYDQGGKAVVCTSNVADGVIDVYVEITEMA